MSLRKVIEGDLCAGCGLCASALGGARARMAFDDRGYLRPRIDTPLSRDEDARLAAACPGHGLALPADDRPRPSIWGPVLDCATGHATDPDLRHRASSGGVLSALLVHLLETGAADYVLHVGAADDVPWLNALDESRDAEAVAARAGSRYAPSAPLADIVRRLEEPRRFVFVGKPCDVAALRMHARTDRRVGQRVVAMLSFMCAGIPSERGVRALLARMGAEPAEVRAFRYRGNGWPGRATATLASGEERSLSYAQSWGDVLSRHLQLRCKLCPDGTGMFADVVCADAWYGGEDGYPSFENAEGRSLVLSRTETGLRLVRDAVAAGRVSVAPEDIANVEAMQPAQARRTRLVRSRQLALRLAGRPAPRYSGLALGAAARGAGIAANLKSFLGMLRRAVTGRL